MNRNDKKYWKIIACVIFCFLVDRPISAQDIGRTWIEKCLVEDVAYDLEIQTEM